MMTGRPKVQNPRDRSATIRITAREQAVLMEMHGTPGRGLRVALDQMLEKTVRSEPTASAERTGPRGHNIAGSHIDEATIIEVPLDAVASHVIVDEHLKPEPRHSHKAATLIRSEAVKGDVMEVWACACGRELPPRKAK
jgi:hypothetical protein